MGYITKLGDKVRLSHCSDGTGQVLYIYEKEGDTYPILELELDDDAIFNFVGHIIMSNKISKMEQMSGKDFLKSL